MQAVIWWVFAAALVIAELLSGTFYLLMLALAAVAGGVAALAGAALRFNYSPRPRALWLRLQRCAARANGGIIAAPRSILILARASISKTGMAASRARCIAARSGISNTPVRNSLEIETGMKSAKCGGIV